MVELARRPHRLIGMEYCLGDGDGSATIWTAPPDIDLNGDGAFDAVGLDYDADGLLDDAMADLDADGVADHMARDHLSEPAYFTDDGTGTWAVSLDRADRRTPARYPATARRPRRWPPRPAPIAAGAA